MEAVMTKERLEQLNQAMKASEFDVIALNPGKSLYYLTGLSFHLLERPVIGLFSKDRAPLLILPELESSKVEACSFEIEVMTYGEDEESRLEAFKSAARKMGLDGQQIGIEPLRLRVMELRLLESIAPEANFASAQAVLFELRIVKDADAITAMRQAAVVAEAALRGVLPLVRVGMTERELESELVLQLHRAGSEPDLPFNPIVASGPNSAVPHATPTERPLEMGDLLLFDWGARINGYVSDITRTFAIGEVDEELSRIYKIVQQANAAGREKIKSDVRCGAIDDAASSVIEKAGYAELLLHRTGHGIGLEAHEPPYIVSANDRLLAPGMTFTVEPGLYLLGKGGVRIEDNVVVTPEGHECLTSYPRDIEVIA
jgi:Xaa-Pro dipeptidase